MPEPAPDAVPEAVRAAVLPLAAEVLGALDPGAVPASLAAVRRFAPRRRVTSGAGPLWLAVERDDAFRARVARAWSHAHPELAADLLADPPAPGAPEDRLDLAVGAALLRPDGWEGRLSAVGTPPAGADAAAQPDADHAHRAHRAEAELRRLAARLTAETERADAAEAELTTLRRELRRLRSDADRSRSEARRAAEHAAEVAAAAERVHAETARVRAAADDDRRRAEDLARVAREDAAALRELAQVRVRLLLDTLVEAGSALREELALPPAGRMPADLVAPPVPGPGGAVRPTSRGRFADDPALLDDLLAMPRAHLLVDGYNVSKLAWPDQPLTEQRRRLTERLATLAGRTGAEVTCCFDGRETDAAGRAPAAPRGVRVLFSQGEIADDLLRRLVRAEPPGRVVVAVTSDRALGADLEAAGARVLPSATLLARLGRV
ncbi:NYN domain-containing protein [Cellulomonas sp. ACRRI]|uniref:NYN domain-containing protein n=1 Tax=Cellulomonas sp. ACRRI TaxID=2918188 RepID=UPI001EF231B6|nr:NYN domain-containing protein [Cellulomonas sp. ACRRI]MCG7287751.1 NYN domain-containing protein [Cellulomonas sp. ACRRI]